MRAEQAATEPAVRPEFWEDVGDKAEQGHDTGDYTRVSLQQLNGHRR